MKYLITAVVTFMRQIYFAWHCAWCNYHCGRARLHDDRIKRLDPKWREKIL